ncbi:outer membrane beta-barrel protein [Runella sp.]|uniref:outer membrane beta-barrel protein n=1 Tax=Runella sp. TaxID=1960881 RepID=UPI003D1226D1
MLRAASLLLVFLTALSSLQAQDIQSNTEGININLYGSFVRWSSSHFDQLDESDPNGIGGGIRLGYGFNQRFEAFAQYEAQTLNLKSDWKVNRMSTIVAGVRANFGGTLQKIRPFAEVGYALTNLTIDPVSLNGRLYEFKLKGPGVWIGVGANYFITPQLAINGRVGGTFGKFNSFLANGQGFVDRPDVRTFRASIGISYFFN